MENQVQAGFDNQGNIVVKNRQYRRRRRNVAELEGRSKKFYTTKQVKIRRKKNGKQVKIRKKSC